MDIEARIEGLATSGSKEWPKGSPSVVQLQPASSAAGEPSCGWCGASLLEERRTKKYCRRRCRQSAWRLRRRCPLSATPATPLTFCYADPAYPGLARKYYRAEANYAGEVDHAALIASLTAAGYAGWALSTSSKALRDILPLCPAGARVCAWVKPIGVPAATYGPHSTWEPVIVVGGRKRRPGVRDWLRAQPARNGGDLPGRKPAAFCVWLFELLGMLPGDHLVDLFPGTGIVGRAWEELSPRSSTTPAEPGCPSVARAWDDTPSSRAASRRMSESRPGPGDAGTVASLLEERRQDPRGGL